MTERIKALTVILDANLREDDAAPLIAAIGCLRGVLEVKTHVADMDDLVAQVRVRHEIWTQLADILLPKKGGQ